ncbi:hypothetical protein [Aliterella atlantica]|uniref:hypothetical protein n=1 Tax=Aliterella atlantica TaxID=1827278 RepID=UPI0005D2FDD7|nr:hypothetical protein [Aliterella atlantica]
MNESNQCDDISINRLRLLLNPYDWLNHLECDGLTQVFHRVLSDEKIQHTVNIGQVIYKPINQTIPLHYWIEVGDLRIDYRLRMWLSETSDVPHGIFHKDSQQSVSYLGEPIDLPLLPLPIIKIIVKPFDSLPQANE